jgi:hypothetical protein
MAQMLRYPRIPYWPYSPGEPRDGDELADPGRFAGQPIVITEKLDGGNTLLHRGEVYARSVSAPSTGKWMAMIKKHHAWKVMEPDVFLYGEDIYGVHSIEYDAIPENETFHAFALRFGNGPFCSFRTMVDYAQERAIPVVPILFEGTFLAVRDLRSFVSNAHAEPSALGGAREGVVIRAAHGFPAEAFRFNVCKSVRAGHVQSEEHWSKNWRACRIASR